jgi:hypothetical protein
MKPQILGWLSPSKGFTKESKDSIDRLLNTRSRWLGDVDPIGVARDHEYMKKLLEFGAGFSLKYKSQSLYTGPCFLPLHGSVGWHHDEGIGHLLNWIISIENLSGTDLNSSDYPCLLAQSGGKVWQIEGLREGDIFIFNGNLGHAWFSNNSCLLVQTTVSVGRTRSQSVLTSKGTQEAP